MNLSADDGRSEGFCTGIHIETGKSELGVSAKNKLVCLAMFSLVHYGK